MLLQTYYLPAIARPLSFLRGLLCLFGDQTLFCRTADFRAVGGYDPELPIMEDVDFCIRLHEAGPSSYRAESPIGPHPLTAVPSPAGDGPRERAAGASSSREQSNTEGAPLAQGYMPREEDTSSQVASSSSDPPPLRQRRQTSVAASLAGGGRSGAGTSDSSPTSRLAGWLAALQVWAMSHCRRRGRVRMEWQPVAHTSGRRLQAWGNFKVCVTSKKCRVDVWFAALAVLNAPWVMSAYVKLIRPIVDPAHCPCEPWGLSILLWILPGVPVSLGA